MSSPVSPAMRRTLVARASVKYSVNSRSSESRRALSPTGLSRSAWIPRPKLVFSHPRQPLYLLPDGPSDDNDAVVAEIRRLNADKRTRTMLSA